MVSGTESRGKDRANGNAARGGAAAAEAKAAPVRRQYLQIKRRFPDTILLFRLGDFYETFEDDAEIAASVLDIALTGRDLGKGVRVPMAGIPHHAAEGYIARLVAAGHKVAICEQIGAPAAGRGLIDRDVARVVTPGTVTEPSMLESRRNSFIASVVLDGSRCGIAYADISTGEFAATQFTEPSPEAARDAAGRELLRLSVVEVVSSELTAQSEETNSGGHDTTITTTVSERWQWTHDHASRVLRDHFGVSSLDGFGLAHMPLATRAAGGLLAYISETQRSRVAQIASLRTYSLDGFVALDAQARRTLELTEGARGEKRHGLVAALDETCTPMGARMLRRWLGQPLLDLAAIQLRQDGIQHLVEDTVLRANIRHNLRGIGDVERLANRAATGSITPREMGVLRRSLEQIELLGDEAARVPGLAISVTTIAQVRSVLDLLRQSLVDDPDGALGSGEVIRPGFSPDLDNHGQLVREARDWIAGLERQERERTGIRTLKVGFNRVSGYFIEITANALQATAQGQGSPNGSVAAVPPDYAIRQSLANSTRFITAQLKEYEARVLGAQETLVQMETDVYRRVVSEIAAFTSALCDVAAGIATLDVLASLAEIAATRGYCRPAVDDSRIIDIKQGRHPTLENLLPAGEFVANDALLDDHDHIITILTGPNMAGKSSWLRQTALIVLLAQVGSFVPAASARIGLVDRIFTRIGAQDDIAAGQSTFMVEMLETANILHHATPRSLVLLDEIGRGTSTWDGLAIARGIVEYLHNSPRLGCRTLFATHYHELTALADLLPGVCCARMDVLEEGDRIVFLHHVVEGAADRSYGIHVAEVAGVPRALTRRARELLSELENGPGVEEKRRRQRNIASSSAGEQSLQLTLFAPPNPVVERLREIDVESLSPIEALTKLYELQQLANDAAPTLD